MVDRNIASGKHLDPGESQLVGSDLVAQSSVDALVSTADQSSASEETQTVPPSKRSSRPRPRQIARLSDVVGSKKAAELARAERAADIEARRAQLIGDGAVRLPTALAAANEDD